MDYDADIFGDYQSNRYKGLRDYHLRSALTSANLSLDNINDWDRNLKKEIIMYNENYSVITRDPCSVLGHIFDSSPLQCSYGRELYYAGKCLSIESTVFPSMQVPLLNDAALMLMGNKLKTKYWATSVFLQRAIIVSNALHSGKELPQETFRTNSDCSMGIVTQRLESIKLTLRIGVECFGVQLDDGHLSIHHIDHLKNWSDKCTERFNIELSCIFGSSLNPTIYPSVDTLYQFWRIWDKYLRMYGNSIYKCVKLFESIVVGTILDKNPNKVIMTRSAFLSSTISEFKSALTANMDYLREPLDEMVTFLSSQQSMQHLSQFYGLYRTWGHPVVCPVSGIRKVHALGTCRKNVSSVIPVQIRRIFMMRFAIWHKGSRGSYPEHRLISSTMENNTVKMILEREGSTVSLTSTLNSPDWDNIRFSKCVEIPKTFNLSEMVADKSISPDRDAFFGLCSKSGGLYDANLKRGVLQWLSREPESCESFLVRVNNDGFTDNESIIGLYQKEREVNETPRMFALMSHSIRNYIVTTESMISDDVLPAFPHITMTNSLLSLQKKIYSVSHKQSLNDKSGFQTFRDVTIIVNIDFEKWNLNFRRETTYPLFEALGDLYGLEHLYNRTYDVFENSLIYLADSCYKPRVDIPTGRFLLDEPCLYTGHLGGFEGLRQKGWTVFTDCGLDLICSRHKCSYTIMGQGDNQVLALTWRTYMLDGDREVSELGKASLTRAFYTFMDDMVYTFEGLGLPIKALETWTSENLFLYGKFPTLKGVPLAMSLKKICRAYYLANEEIMTLECSLATVQSNAMAACMSDVTSFVPYIIYKIQVFLAIKAFWDYHVLLGRGAFEYESRDSWRFTSSSGTKYSYVIDKPQSKWNFVILLTWFPKVLGGLSVASWYDFLMRGFPDRVASALTWVRHLIGSINDGSIKTALRCIYQCHINPEKNFTLLVEDPCALNLMVPVDARASVRQAVQELFENMSDVKNEEFLSLFKFNKNWEKDKFCEALCEADIIHPRFLHDLAAATLGGYVDSVVSKISKASTINKLALHSSCSNPGSKIERHESNYMAYLLWKTSVNNPHRSFVELSCPTEQARELRMRSWGKMLEGVSVPHPMAFLTFRDCTRNPTFFDSCDNNFIMVTLPEDFATGNLQNIHNLGNAPPYLGSETKEKIGSDPARQVFGKEPLISRPLNLLRVINWFVTPHSHSEAVIYKLLESVSDLNPRDYVSREMGVTGSEAHRYRDQALKHGVMSANMYTLGSHMHISTDPWVKYTRGAENYTINYQAILCCIQSLVGGHIFKCYEERVVPSREYHFHESCTSCIVPLTEEFHDLASDVVLDLIPSERENPYLWVDEASLTLKYKNDPQLILQLKEMSYHDYSMFPNKRVILTSWIAESIVDDILMGSNDQFGPRLLDSKDYPRVMYKKLGVQETYKAVAKALIARAGIKYTSTDTCRVAYPQTAKELAADDVMKCSVGSLMGLSMFYSWPEKFYESWNCDQDVIFPDTCPPTLSSACHAVQMNLRDVIRKCNMSAPPELIISRADKYPLMQIKCYWYLILCSEGQACPSCIKSVSDLEFLSSYSLISHEKCDIGHLILTPRMKRIRVLTASIDRILKDSSPYIDICRSVNATPSILRCPAELEWSTLQELMVLHRSSERPLISPMSNKTWQYCSLLPTNSKCRVYEILSILHHKYSFDPPSEGLIVGDGLGTTSYILSTLYEGTNWIAASLQDSERAVPQSYPHILIPGNPNPQSNVNYNISKMLYNDLAHEEFVERWKPWINGGVCWFDLETQGDKIPIVANLLRLADWDWLILRSDYTSYTEAARIHEIVINHSAEVNLYITGCMDVERLESVIIARCLTSDPIRQIVISPLNYASSYSDSTANLYTLTGSMLYAEYLASLEETCEISKMIKRCDYWFSSVGITHLLSCKKLMTPVWWDLQTGKIPSEVKNLGKNKAYFLYQSDSIALQARLMSLAISMLRYPSSLNRELRLFEYWKMSMEMKRGKLSISIKRSGEKLYYGPDHLLISKYVPILRKLNHMNNRWWKFMPDTITFHTHIGSPGFWVSNMSQILPVDLPSVS